MSVERYLRKIEARLALMERQMIMFGLMRAELQELRALVLAQGPVGAGDQCHGPGFAPLSIEIPEGECGTAREAPTASVSADAPSTETVAPPLAEPAVPPPAHQTEAPAVRPAPHLARRPKIDLRRAPSSMEQQAASWRGG